MHSLTNGYIDTQVSKSIDEDSCLTLSTIFNVLKCAKENILDINIGYGDNCITASAIFEHVVGLDSRLPCLSHVQEKISINNVNNVSLVNNDFFHFECEDTYDCVLFSDGLKGFNSQKKQLRAILKATKLLKKDGMLVVVSDEEKRSGDISLSEMLGLEYKGSYTGKVEESADEKYFLTFNLPVWSAHPKKNSTLKLACFGSMPFHFRSLKPLSELFENSIVTLSVDEVISWRPDVIAVADGWSVEYWRDYCDANNVLLIGMRHGSVTRYGFAESQYNFADYMCGSPWDIEDTLLSDVQPRKGFLITGNSWVDQVFQIEKKVADKLNPTFLFAPTYNPEISSAVFFGERVVSLVRSVYPESKIIIKPHPAIVQHEHGFVVNKDIFRQLMQQWREQCADDPLIELIDNPEASIAESFVEADILIADASSLIYEFMTLDRPIILYSATEKVSHWDYNPDAPGNAWRDIGLEFSDDKTFLNHIRHAFKRHEDCCKIAQKERTKFLHGIYQDGKSINRVADAISKQPKLDIVIFGQKTSVEEKRNIFSKMQKRFSFCRLSIIDNTLSGQTVGNEYVDWQHWQSGAANVSARHRVTLLIDADQGKLPGSAHQISRAIKKLARNEIGCMVLRAGERAALSLLKYNDVDAFIQNSLNNKANGETLWTSDALNVTPARGVVRNPGKDWFMMSDSACFTMNASIDDVKPGDSFLRLNLSVLERQQYDNFPFNTTVFINDIPVKKLVIDSVFNRELTLPFHPDSDGQTNIKVVSDGRTHEMRDITENISFFMRTENININEVDETDRGIEAWLEKRTLSAIQEKFVEDYQSKNTTVTSVVCVILVDDKKLAYDETLKNIALHNDQNQMLKLIPFVINTNGSDLNDESVDIMNVHPDAIANSINQLIQDSECGWFTVMNAGESFTQSGALVAELQLPLANNCAAIFTDMLLNDNDGMTSVALHPEFNLDLLLSLPSIMAENWIFKREVFISLGGFTADYPQAMQFEYITRLIEYYGIQTIGHLEEPTFKRESYTLKNNDDQKSVIKKHLNNRGFTDASITSDMPGVWRLHYNVQQNPLVSIIIPTKDQLPLLITCITTLMEKTSYLNYEILIVDNNSELPETLAWLKGISEIDPRRIRVIPYPKPFNYSAMNNMAAQQALGEYLVLLNNDTAIIQNDWLQNMLNHAMRPEVGIVGAKLFYPNGRIQHAGVVLGLRGPAEHPFIGRSGDETGYLYRLVADQNYTAVTAACMMVRKDIYEEVGGLDEINFRVSYNDIDFCLKVRERGYLTVWTPYAHVMHEGSVSQKKVDSATVEVKHKRFTSEQDAMYEKWLPLIANDPAYNNCLSLSGEGFELMSDSLFTWRPVFWKPAPQVVATMADLTGCGNYRIIKPFEAMRDAGLIQGNLSQYLINIPQLSHLDADSLVLQRQITPEFHEWAARVAKFIKSFKVFELDDYLPNLPVKSVHRADMPKDILKSIRKSLSMMDRFVVSTAALANRFDGAHHDIQIVENRLPCDKWSNLVSLRGQGRKPRVGWAGGVSHTGDLEMIVDVVKAFANRVEWVFMGMCPPKLMPYIHEYHPGVSIDDYPAKLASLNLDLALAPVEDNEFNRCKSNLRLLEYGACGYPVICSDIECYRYDMPVTRVRNRFKDWADAIEMHLDDRETSWRTGDALKELVLSQWMLTGEPLERWAKIWLP
ncbi:glycosyltransferase [Erwinia sp. 9145]|uniref:glycosyltransferase n=1 Tax=Erwinia sp. 9145 TaxID=1500895 RepID=UPI0006903637|nr:glycosyltransferase [Erwinia sp. 9145]